MSDSMENKVSELGTNLAYTQGYRDAFIHKSNKVKCPYINPVLKKAYNKGRRDAKRF
jgi:hypothetical protein